MTSIHQILPEHNFKFPPPDGSTRRNFHRFISFMENWKRIAIPSQIETFQIEFPGTTTDGSTNLDGDV